MDDLIEEIIDRYFVECKEFEKMIEQYEAECEAEDIPPTVWGALTVTWQER